jgi:hypothetical protein
MSQHIKHRVIKQLFKNSYPYEAIDTNCTRSASLDIGSSCGTLRPTITQSPEYEHAITTSRRNHINDAHLINCCRLLLEIRTLLLMPLTRSRSRSASANAPNPTIHDLISSIQLLQADVLILQRNARKRHVLSQGHGIIYGRMGPPGRDGVDGRNGIDGRNGRDGAAGRDGVDGINGIDGKNGRDGAPGRNGVDGINGVAGIGGTNGAKETNGLVVADVADSAHCNCGPAGKNGLDVIDGNGHGGLASAVSHQGTILSMQPAIPLHRILATVSGEHTLLPLSFNVPRRANFSQLMLYLCSQLALPSTVPHASVFALEHEGIQVPADATPATLGYGDAGPGATIHLRMICK